MATGYLDIAFTPSVEAAQASNGSAGLYDKMRAMRMTTRLGPAEEDFITRRDSLYLASAGETGWPYVQHRGGPAGFVKVIDDKTLAFADFRGNRQYISLGNTTANDRVSLFLMDYPNRRRLKIYARLEVRDLSADPGLAERIVLAGYRAIPERAMVFHIEAFDWNCPQHISPRFTEAEIDQAVQPLREQLAALEAENRALKDRLASSGQG
ncbi:MAG: pyridoxamine 5'-phosphate oxidase family protein [Sphingomonas sp.]|nr:pyridoxamine 5'-phosphate oxidase family protein [Sphingomonas sp.]